MMKRSIRSLAILMIAAMVFAMMPLSVSAASKNPGKVKIKIAKVGKVSAKKNTATVTIKWKKASNATGYVVYGMHASDGKWIKIKKCGRFKRGIKIKNVPAGKVSFRVQAIRKVKGKTYKGKFSAVKTKFLKSKMTLQKCMSLNGGNAVLRNVNADLARQGANMSFSGNTMIITYDLAKMPDLAGEDLSHLSNLTETEKAQLRNALAADPNINKIAGLVPVLRNASGVKAPVIRLDFKYGATALCSLTYR